jgi:hypothetical protein
VAKGEQSVAKKPLSVKLEVSKRLELSCLKGNQPIKLKRGSGEK